MYWASHSRDDLAAMGTTDRDRRYVWLAPVDRDEVERLIFNSCKCASRRARGQDLQDADESGRKSPPRSLEAYTVFHGCSDGLSSV